MISIRRHQPDDLPALRALLTEEQTAEYALDRFMREPGAGVMEAYFAEMMSWVSELDGAIFVAEIEGAPVGFVAVIVEDKDEIWTSIARRGYITNIVVSLAHRGEGVAQRLMVEAEAYARLKGCQHLLLDVLAGNAPALKAYERFGFRAREIQMHKPLT